MKKLILTYIIIANSIFANITEYELFNKGKTEFEKQNYDSAQKSFESLEKTYPNSNLVKSDYPDYYIGLNYYNLRNYEKAIEYLKKANYLPLEYRLSRGYFKKKKKDFFEYERILYIAYSYQKLNNLEESKKEFLKLYRNYYDHDLIKFEKKALSELIKIDPYFKIIYDIKFNNNLKNLSKLRPEDILKVANYIYSSGQYKQSAYVYQQYLKLQKNPWVEISVLRALFRAKEHDEVIQLSKQYIKTNKYKSYVYYYLANSTRRKGDIKNSIKYFKKVKKGSHVKESEYLIGRLYYFDKDYKNSEFWLKKSDWISAKKMLIDMYFEIGEKINFTNEAINFIKKYPDSDDSAFYRFKLYTMAKSGYLNYILLYNPNTLYYEKAIEIIGEKPIFKNFNTDKYLITYKKELEKVEELKKFDDKNYAKIELASIDFKKEDLLFAEYTMSKIFADNKLYSEAVRTAIADGNNFLKYKELSKLLYPKYYENIVKKYSKLYNVEEELIYSIIRQESIFENNVISRAAAYGLMQLIMPTAKSLDANVTKENLLDPDKNIQLGTKYLSKLLKTFDGNLSHVIAAYNGGPGNAAKWEKDENGDLVIEKIPFPETRKYVEKVLNNYYKYKRIYKN